MDPLFVTVPVEKIKGWPFAFQKRCPEQYDGLVECSAFVNFRCTQIGETPVIALLLNGPYEN